MSIVVTIAKRRLPERFASKVNFDGPLMPGMMTPCWFWMAAWDGHGYGQYSLKGKVLRAHRVAYNILVGPIPEGFEPHHRCEVPPCVRPDHLQLLTRAEHNGLRYGDFCKYGHRFDSVDSKGRRVCKQCNARRSREYQARKRVAT